MASALVLRKKAKKLRLFSFWVEKQEELSSPWLRRAWARADSKKKVRADLDSFLGQVEQSGVHPEGTTLCNSEMTGGNDISLIYPWLHISSTMQDINTWIRKEEQRSVQSAAQSPLSSCTGYGSLDRQESMRSYVGKRKLVQGTYCIVETVLPSQEVAPAGEQLCVLLGFRTTDDNCVDTTEADSERSEEARSWREWTGIGTLYQNLSQEETVEVVKVDFLESHVPDHTAVFHYLVLLFLQVSSQRGKLGVLDAVARFRVRNMSGYVTVYSNLSSISDEDKGSTVSLGENIKNVKQTKDQAKKEFFKHKF